MNESLQSANFRVWQKTPHYSVIYSTPTWSFLSAYDQVVHKKRSASIFLNWEIQAQRDKVIKSQILNSVRISSKIGFLLLLLSIHLICEQNPPSSTHILGVGQGTIFQIKIHIAVTQTLNQGLITPPQFKLTALYVITPVLGIRSVSCGSYFILQEWNKGLIFLDRAVLGKKQLQKSVLGMVMTFLQWRWSKQSVSLL